MSVLRADDDPLSVFSCGAWSVETMHTLMCLSATHGCMTLDKEVTARHPASSVQSWTVLACTCNATQTDSKIAFL